MCSRCLQAWLQHLNSKTHRGTNVICPFCKDKYTTASGLIHHLETSSCPRAPELNRESILCIVRERDLHNAITNKQIKWHQDENIKYSATEASFNGCYWECYLCSAEFTKISALNSHLNSPVHKRKVYHCPNSRAKCGKEFVTLAGLMNHLESGACACMSFERVQQQVGNVFRPGKLITFSQ
jgi:Zinc-finger of C2H2 type